MSSKFQARVAALITKYSKGVTSASSRTISVAVTQADIDESGTTDSKEQCAWLKAEARKASLTYAGATCSTDASGRPTSVQVTFDIDVANAR